MPYSLRTISYLESKKFDQTDKFKLYKVKNKVAAGEQRLDLVNEIKLSFVLEKNKLWNRLKKYRFEKFENKYLK